MALPMRRLLRGIGAVALIGASCTPRASSDDAGLILDAGLSRVDASASPPLEGSAPPPAECVSTFRTTPDCVQPEPRLACSAGFCTIARGCFVSGSPPCQVGRGASSEPEAQVTLTHDFQIGQHEVTVGEWKALGFNHRPQKPLEGESLPGFCEADNCSVVAISWFEAIAYANRLSRASVPALPTCYELTCADADAGVDCTSVKLTSEDVYSCRGYRLPTEAEWEYAARAGTRTSHYGGKMTITKAVVGLCPIEPALESTVWYCGNSVDPSTSPPQIHSRPVMSKIPNAWGLHDMLGSAEEWTSDAYDGLGLRAGPYVDPGKALGTSPTRACRGGHIGSPAFATTASWRLGSAWTSVGPVGFRLARTLGPG